ncbi:hypothetical protein [Caulobacter sp.]|uniref:hypothetical protein n=1 Tax=Caulobacter sp. TaxID=78 RepID=UPI003BAC0730
MTPVDNDMEDPDLAETFDEDNQNVAGEGDMKTFEQMPRVLDVTTAEGDADDDDALIAEDLDDDEIIALERESLDEAEDGAS